MVWPHSLLGTGILHISADITQMGFGFVSKLRYYNIAFFPTFPNSGRIGIKLQHTSSIRQTQTHRQTGQTDLSHPCPKGENVSSSSPKARLGQLRAKQYTRSQESRRDGRFHENKKPTQQEKQRPISFTFFPFSQYANLYLWPSAHACKRETELACSCTSVGLNNIQRCFDDEWW